MMRFQESFSYIFILIGNFAATKGETLLYAIDIKDGNGLQIYKRPASIESCLIYKTIGTDRSIKLPLYLFYTSGQWKIFQNLDGWTVGSNESNCVPNNGNILLYQREGEKPQSEGWYNHSSNIPNQVLSVYPLEECTTYKGVYVDAYEFRQNLVLSNGNMDTCREIAFSYRDWENSQLIVTTRSQSQTENNIENKTLCKYNSIDYLVKGEVVLSSDDEQAQIYIGNRNCFNAIRDGSPPTTIDIREAKSHNANFTRILTAKDAEFPYEAVIGGGVGSLVLLVLVCVCWHVGCGCCGQRKSRTDPGHYGRASIDSNFQYGEEKEYYQYQYDKKQTRVVDENEMYAIYDQE